ncbi:hypothetical protein GIB67_039773 [Kingdonia uniflora]|uniref:Uncharacterized protein n=1 Tax=Kingdonia uniflora TaxID=39325 RepID=A0A7J7MQH0_9MAGN|nr:hypothetical protein GIB67_039773 [Kingdonia uniflora]
MLKIKKLRKLPLDVQHRWNSTFFILDAVLSLKRPITQYQMSKSLLHTITDDDWVVAELLRDFIKVFYEATLCFSKSYHVTSSEVIGHLVNICEIFEKYKHNRQFENICAEMEVLYPFTYTSEIELARSTITSLFKDYESTVDLPSAVTVDLPLALEAPPAVNLPPALEVDLPPALDLPLPLPSDLPSPLVVDLPLVLIGLSFVVLKPMLALSSLCLTVVSCLERGLLIGG